MVYEDTHESENFENVPLSISDSYLLFTRKWCVAAIAVALAVRQAEVPNRILAGVNLGNNVVERQAHGVVRFTDFRQRR